MEMLFPDHCAEISLFGHRGTHMDAFRSKNVPAKIGCSSSFYPASIDAAIRHVQRVNHYASRG